MSLALKTQRPRQREQQATRVALFIAGFGLAAWAPLVPYAQARLGLGDAALGALLLCLGTGSLIAMPLVGALIARLGCRTVITAASLTLCVSFPCLATAASPAWLAAALLLFGASVGSIDVAGSLQAVIVEQASGQAMMSGFHGLFSLGGIAGAGSMGLLLWAGLSPLAATLVVAPAILGLLLAFGRHMLAQGGERHAPLFVRPRGIVLLLCLLGFITFLTEGAMLDWSAVLLVTLRHVDPSRAGMGYAAFATMMTAGRLGGDRLVQALGGRRVLVLGSACAACGLALAALLPAAATALAGFAMVGLGASNIVPVLYSATGRQTVMPSHLAVAAVTTIGYSGILAGPALIGFLAHAAGLRAAFLCIAVLILAVAASARLVARPAQGTR